jgi:hypothetical protein
MHYSKQEKNDLFHSYSMCLKNKINKHGGLNSQDQLRSRTSFVSRLTFENYQECPSCRDQLFFSWSRFLKLRLFNPDLAASIFSSRLLIFSRFVEFFKICWDFSRFTEISRHYRDFFSYFTIKNLDKLRNLDQQIG